MNPAFVISIASPEIPFTKASERKPMERHWSSKSIRSRAGRQRFSDLPYYVPEPHSIIRRHSTESWSATDSPSFGDVVKTAERLTLGGNECTSFLQSDNSAKVGAAVSVGALAVCDSSQTNGQLDLHSGSIISRSRSLGDLTQPCPHSVHGEAVVTSDVALQNDVLVDRVERKLRNFHVT